MRDHRWDRVLQLLLVPRIDPLTFGPTFWSTSALPCSWASQAALTLCCHRVTALLSAGHSQGFPLGLPAWGAGCLCRHGLAFRGPWQGDQGYSSPSLCMYSACPPSLVPTTRFQKSLDSTWTVPFTTLPSHKWSTYCVPCT